MTANMVLLEKITVGAAGAASIDFTSIPSTYTDLCLLISTRVSDIGSGDDEVIAQFNADTGSNYSGIVLYGYGGGSTGSYSPTVFRVGYSSGQSQTANTFGNSMCYIPNYLASTQKSGSTDWTNEDNSSSATFRGIAAAKWTGTAAITSIKLKSATGKTFSQYSTFYLYGVAAYGTTPVIAPFATGGDTIMTDGTYWYHTFISSGTFTPAKALTADYLVVAGGGGGGVALAGNYNGGAGGAGGLRSTVTATGGGGSLETALSLTTTGYTVTVGAGGGSGTNGSNSVFSTITSTGGGRGFGATAVGNGGSGGAKAGLGTANQGYNGGSGSSNWDGGGGGAGQVGTTTTGGNGVATSITGSSVTYAGGGGTAEPASAGGTGGGGAGALTTTGTSGTANLGGGGGGSRSLSGSISGSSGGSGIVIVRYSV